MWIQKYLNKSERQNREGLKAKGGFSVCNGFLIYNGINTSFAALVGIFFKFNE